MKLRTTFMLTLISSALTLGVATANEHGKMGGKSHDMNCPSMGMMDSTFKFLCSSHPKVLVPTAQPCCRRDL